jgi:hypothetical protein
LSPLKFRQTTTQITHSTSSGVIHKTTLGYTEMSTTPNTS